jgi:hypothetical protein
LAAFSQRRRESAGSSWALRRRAAAATVAADAAGPSASAANAACLSARAARLLCSSTSVSNRTELFSGACAAVGGRPAARRRPTSTLPSPRRRSVSARGDAAGILNLGSVSAVCLSRRGRGGAAPGWDAGSRRY